MNEELHPPSHSSRDPPPNSRIFMVYYCEDTAHTVCPRRRRERTLRSMQQAQPHIGDWFRLTQRAGCRLDTVYAALNVFLVNRRWLLFFYRVTTHTLAHRAREVMAWPYISLCGEVFSARRGWRLFYGLGWLTGRLAGRLMLFSLTVALFILDTFFSRATLSKIPLYIFVYIMGHHRPDMECLSLY